MFNYWVGNSFSNIVMIFHCIGRFGSLYVQPDRSLEKLLCVMLLGRCLANELTKLMRWYPLSSSSLEMVTFSSLISTVSPVSLSMVSSMAVYVVHMFIVLVVLVVGVDCESIFRMGKQIQEKVLGFI